MSIIGLLLYFCQTNTIKNQMRKTIIKPIVLIAIVLQLIALSNVKSNTKQFFNIGIENGLSQLTVLAIYQDELGAMWFGTREGVNRYFNNSMEVFRPISKDSNSLCNNVVKAISGDKKGNVYILTQAGINRYELRTARMSVIQRTEADAMIYGRKHLWIADNNKISYWDKNKKTHYIDLPNTNSAIKALYETSDQHLVAGTVSTGLWLINPKKKVRQIIKDCGVVSSIFEDNLRNIWVGTWNNGLYKINSKGEISNFRHDPKKSGSLSSDFVRTICQDNDGTMWIGTRKGLEQLNQATNEFTHFKTGTGDDGMLTNESIWALYKDQQGILWIGTYFGGVNYFNPAMDLYTRHDLRNGSLQNKSFPVIGNIIEDKWGRLLLGTEGDGLIIYNIEKKTYINIRSNSNAGISSDNIKCFYYDKKNDHLWMGTHLGGLNLLNLKTLTTKQYKTIQPNWPESDIIRAILPYENDLLVATHNGLFRFNMASEKFSIFSDQIHEHLRFFYDIKIRNNELWMGGRKLYKYNLESKAISKYEHNPTDPTSLSNNVGTRLFVDSKNQLWVGTSGGGLNLYKPDSDSFEAFNSETVGLSNDYISNVTELSSGNLIIATTRGLSILNPSTKELRNYRIENGFPLNSLFNGGIATLSNNEIYVSGMNGMISFFEDKLNMGLQYFNINFINLSINNKTIKPNDASKILSQALPYTNKIKLNHRQSMISVEFATNNYISINQPEFQYKLEGLSNAWIALPAGTNKLNFMNLSAGDYNLVLRAIYPGNDKEVAFTSLRITILPPFWHTWYAYIFYVLILSFIVWRYVKFSRSRLLLKASLEYEKREKQHIEEVNQSKLRFFTNISHEFRTPLTLIAGQIDMMLQMSNIHPVLYNKILNVKRNAQNMQHLINELLEFRKTEQGHLQLKVAKHNIVQFLREIYLSFVDYADHKQIRYQFVSTDDTIDIWYDSLQLQKVFYNLITNAFKYTPANGTISIKLQHNETELIVEIIDTGVGIAANDIAKIFDRFYQAENGLHLGKVSPGSGIGLALSKTILTAHGGTVVVNSELQQGSCFTIKLLKGRNHFSDEQITEVIAETKNYEQQSLDVEPEFMQEIMATQLVDNKPRFSMIIVEDNNELRELLRNIFEPIYTVFTACDGQEGLEMTLEHQPDIVLSDLMMPRLSGVEMCSKIKSNFAVSHIPVVLLTAQTAIEYNIEGLKLGADDYITKPFNLKTLITRCNNLVNNRRLLQEKYSKQVDFSPLMLATNKIDSEFIEKVQQVVEKHIDNADFDVKLFSEELGLSRTRLFTKLKGITGQTPNDYILNVRLKKAAEMLQYQPEYNISDITYMLGFNTPRYFSKCFKDQFNITPLAFRKQFHADFNNEQSED